MYLVSIGSNNVIQDVYSDSVYTPPNVQLHEITTGEFEKISNSSSIGSWALINGLVKAYVPVRDITVIRSNKLASLTASRDKATTLSVTAHTRQWQADERSQKLLSSAITLAMAGAPLPAAWRDVANSNMPITVIGELVTIANAMRLQTEAAFVKSWKLKADVAAAATAEAVALVVW